VDISTFLNDPSVKKEDIFQFLIEGTFRGRETSAALVIHLFEIWYGFVYDQI